jgi:uncharacterized membrane protein YqjE
MRAPERSPDHPGFAASVRGLTRSLVALVRTRAELLSVELEEEKERRKEMVILAAVGTLFAALGFQVATLLLIVVFWDTYRIAAIGGVTGLYLGIAAWAFWRLRNKWRHHPTPFAATLEELAKDLDALQGRHE